MTTQTGTAVATNRRADVALVVARVAAGVLGAAQLAGVVLFVLLAPEEAVWLGLWIDVPVIAVMLAGIALKLAVAVAPGLSASRRILLGLVAVALGAAATLVKIPLYDEPEGVLFLGFDVVLAIVLLLARRGEGPRR